MPVQGLEVLNRTLFFFLKGSISKSKRPVMMNHLDRKSTRLNSSHLVISYAVFCLKKKNSDAWTRHRKKRLLARGFESRSNKLALREGHALYLKTECVSRFVRSSRI